jgi:hypothetical protein
MARFGFAIAAKVAAEGRHEDPCDEAFLLRADSHPEGRLRIDPTL